MSAELTSINGHSPTCSAHSGETCSCGQSFAARMREMRQRNRQSADAAKPAMERLADVCAAKSGQSYKLRSLLYSAWNGKPASVLQIVELDFAIREDLLTVFRAFGSDDFFYNELSLPLKKRGLFPWFTEESEVQP